MLSFNKQSNTSACGELCKQNQTFCLSENFGIETESELKDFDIKTELKLKEFLTSEALSWDSECFAIQFTAMIHYTSLQGDMRKCLQEPLAEQPVLVDLTLWVLMYLMETHS